MQALGHPVKSGSLGSDPRPSPAHVLLNHPSHPFPHVTYKLASWPCTLVMSAGHVFGPCLRAMYTGHVSSPCMRAMHASHVCCVVQVVRLGACLKGVEFDTDQPPLSPPLKTKSSGNPDISNRFLPPWPLDPSFRPWDIDFQIEKPSTRHGGRGVPGGNLTRKGRRGAGRGCPQRQSTKGGRTQPRADCRRVRSPSHHLNT